MTSHAAGALELTLKRLVDRHVCEPVVGSRSLWAGRAMPSVSYLLAITVASIAPGDSRRDGTRIPEIRNSRLAVGPPCGLLSSFTSTGRLVNCSRSRFFGSASRLLPYTLPSSQGDHCRESVSAATTRPIPGAEGSPTPFDTGREIHAGVVKPILPLGENPGYRQAEHIGSLAPSRIFDCSGDVSLARLAGRRSPET